MPEVQAFIEHVSAHAFDRTLMRLEEAIMRSGLTVFARIDHAAAAATIEMTMPPTTVLIYGSPKGGTPIMLAEPRAALDLPLRVLVREDPDRRVFVGFHPIVPLLLEAGVTPDVAERLAPAQALLIEGLQP